MPQTYISVIVPAYNEAAVLADCLRSIHSQQTVRPFEVLVVDNASTDATAAIAVTAGARLVYAAVKGVCAARQAGLSAAYGQVIVSADADTFYPPGWLAAIERQFTEHPDMSGLIGTYRFPEAYVMNSLLAAWEHMSLRLHYAYGWQPYVAAANLAFRKESLASYDPRLGSGGDELFVVRKLRQHGHVIFDVSNPVLTSARRVRGRFWAVLLQDFGVHYLGSYFLSTPLFGRPAATCDLRPNDRRAVTWPYTAAGVALCAIGLVGLISVLKIAGTLLEIMTPQPGFWIGCIALITGGAAYCMFRPTSQLIMPALWRVRTTQKIVALTFDDGPNEPYTSQIAGIIESYGGKGTFFQCGHMVTKHPEVTARLAKAGHTIGNHGYDHRFSTLWRPRKLLIGIQATSAEISQATGTSVRFFRAPWLTKSPIIAWAVAQAGLVPVSGTFLSYREVFQPDGITMAKRCLAKIQPGSVIILHDSRETHGGDRTETVRAVEFMCRALTNDGYRLVSLDELI